MTDRRQREPVGVVAVSKDEAREVRGTGTGVEQLHPVAGRSAARLHFVDAHDDAAVVGGALGHGGIGLEVAAAVRAAAVGRGGMRRPGVRIDQDGAVWREQPDRVRRPQAEAERGLLDHVVAVRRNRRPAGNV